ncbi:hypothetical protein, partial [Pelobium manganitolerans]|uniref:hypothetical protein n=1 Tax=Pelobium manganitolerans TaxID=1842495 RepID=UPI001C7D89A6
KESHLCTPQTQGLRETGNRAGKAERGRPEKKIKNNFGREKKKLYVCAPQRREHRDRKQALPGGGAAVKIKKRRAQ